MRRYDIIALQEVFGTPFLPCICRQAHLIKRMRELGYKCASLPNPSAPGSSSDYAVQYR